MPDARAWPPPLGSPDTQEIGAWGPGEPGNPGILGVWGGYDVEMALWGQTPPLARNEPRN